MPGEGDTKGAKPQSRVESYRGVNLVSKNNLGHDGAPGQPHTRTFRKPISGQSAVVG